VSDLPKMGRFPLIDLDPEYLAQRKLEAEAAKARTPINWTITVESIDGDTERAADLAGALFCTLSHGAAAHRWASDLDDEYDDAVIAITVTGNGESYPLEITTEIRRERIVAIRRPTP